MKITLEDSSAIDPEQWDAFIEKSPQGSPYTYFHTLDILLPGWKAIIAEQDGQWEAVFPFPVKEKYMIRYCFQLPWTQHSGVILAPFDLNAPAYYEKVKKILNGIIDMALEHCIAFDFALSPKFDYPLPFLWRGFELTPRYTYQLDLTATDEIIEHFSSSARKKVRKSMKSGYVVQPMQNISELIRIYREEVGNRLSGIGHENYVQLEQLIRHLLKNDQAITLEARLEDKMAGGIVLYTDKNTAYFPLGITPMSHRSSGVMSLLILEAMKVAKEKGCTTFDFEGSVIEDIERYFRGFGASPIVYMNVTRFPWWLKLIKQK